MTTKAYTGVNHHLDLKPIDPYVLLGLKKYALETISEKHDIVQIVEIQMINLYLK